MPESWSESYDDTADIQRITPTRARHDHWNVVENLLVCIYEGNDDATFRARLASYGRTRIQSFSERFPQDRYPGIIEAQPAGTVERFDQIAAEVTALIQSDQLTIQKVREVANEMRALCDQ